MFQETIAAQLFQQMLIADKILSVLQPVLGKSLELVAWKCRTLVTIYNIPFLTTQMECLAILTSLKIHLRAGT